MTAPFDFESCRRLPLADAAMQWLRHTLDDEFTTRVFERHRGRSYEKEIPFSTFVQTIMNSMLEHHASGHQTFLHAQKDEVLPVSVQATYGKLRRMPFKLSIGLFADAAERMHEDAPSVLANPLPASFHAFRCLDFEIKKIGAIAKELGVVRNLTNSVNASNLLVAQDMATQGVVAIAVAEGKTVSGLVAQARLRDVSRPILWVSNTILSNEREALGQLCQHGNHFVLYQRNASVFVADSDFLPFESFDDRGGPCHEERGWLVNGSTRCPVRKITTRNRVPLIVVTSLLEPDCYPAFDVLKLCRNPSGFDEIFNDAVKTFDLRDLINSSPEATVFQVVLYLLLFNSIQAIRRLRPTGFIAVGS